MHTDELWQLYDQNGRPIVDSGWLPEKGAPKSALENVWVGAVIVWLYRKTEQGIELLFQQRSDKVDRNPGKWDTSVGGHINCGEDVIQTVLREAKEEIGVELEPDKLKYVFSLTASSGWNIFIDAFFYDWTGKEDNFRFNDDEVSGVKWISRKDFDAFVAENAKRPLQEAEFTLGLTKHWADYYMDEAEVGNLKNYAFIDGNNLYLGTKNQGIKLDYRKLRLYLKNKLNVEKAFLFVGRDKGRTKLYEHLRKSGYELVFKPAVFYADQDGNRMMKGNVDAELVLHSAAVEYDNYDKAVVVTGDGDFACLMDFLRRNDKLEKIITPTANFSLLLRPYIKDILPIKIIKDRIQE